jgi:hypothetical protein
VLKRLDSKILVTINKRIDFSRLSGVSKKALKYNSEKDRFQQAYLSVEKALK